MDRVEIDAVVNSGVNQGDQKTAGHVVINSYGSPVDKSHNENIKKRKNFIYLLISVIILILNLTIILHLLVNLYN